MRSIATILIIGLLTFGIGFYSPGVEGNRQIAQMVEKIQADEPVSETPFLADQCKCYCGGKNWDPGSIACMGGFKYRCVDRGGEGTNCGWDPVKQGSDAVRCDGGEHCK